MLSPHSGQTFGGFFFATARPPNGAPMRRPRANASALVIVMLALSSTTIITTALRGGDVRRLHIPCG